MAEDAVAVAAAKVSAAVVTGEAGTVAARAGPTLPGARRGDPLASASSW
jgi:hypothetical protein